MTQPWAISSESPDATIGIGHGLGSSLPGGLVVGLVGPLGAGKTLLVGGIAAGNAGRPCEVTSPTFTLVHEYSGRLTLYHMDAYRLAGPADFWRLGVADLIRSDSAVIVEWADRVAAVIPEDSLWIEIQPITHFTRRFLFTAAGGRAQECLDALASVLAPFDKKESRT